MNRAPGSGVVIPISGRQPPARRLLPDDQALVTAEGGGMVPAPVLRHPAFAVGSAAAGRFGGFKKAGFLWKSIMSKRLVAFASRRVRAGRFHFSSTVLRIEVWS